MLVVFFVVPAITAPKKAMFSKKSAAQVVLFNLVGKIFRAILEVGGIIGRDNFFAVDGFYVRVVQRIDVDRQAVAVKRNSVREGNVTEIEARRIIVAHGKFIVGVVFVDEPNFLYRVARRIKLLEDFNQRLGDSDVANEFAFQSFAAQIFVQDVKISQLVQRQRAIFFV